MNAEKKQANDARRAQIAELCPNWRSVVVTFGKYTGKTVEFVYVTDSIHLYTLRNAMLTSDEDAAIQAAILYKEMVDPFSDSNDLLDLG